MSSGQRHPSLPAGEQTEVRGNVVKPSSSRCHLQASTSGIESKLKVKIDRWQEHNVRAGGGEEPWIGGGTERRKEEA